MAVQNVVYLAVMEREVLRHGTTLDGAEFLIMCAVRSQTLRSSR